MLPIIKGSEVKELDFQYAKSKGISSLELMEKAALSFVEWFCSKFEGMQIPIYIFCGPGNNGGDGLAIGRLLYQKGFSVNIFYLVESHRCATDYKMNFDLLPKAINKSKIEAWNGAVDEESFIIDAIFGVGLNRPLSFDIENVVEKLSQAKAIRIAVDIPTGLPSDSLVEGMTFKADHTVTFQFPKLSLLFPEHVHFVGDLHILDIGVGDSFLLSFNSSSFYIREKDVAFRHKRFHRFSHKGDFGRVLFIGGSSGKLGALFLSAYAALRSGSGLVFCAPESERPLTIQIPYVEVMLFQLSSNSELTQMDAIGVGPGWGQEIDPDYFLSIMIRFNKPMVIDADALNLLGRNPQLIKSIPKNSILTPHLKEFERLVGIVSNHKDRIEMASSFAKENNVILVLKGAHTLIALPDGRRLFNSTGNQFMASAGSGDVLTGMITSFLGQGYSPENAAICGVFHHGLAGELASVSKRRGTVASDIVEKIPDTYLTLDIL